MIDKFSRMDSRRRVNCLVIGIIMFGGSCCLGFFKGSIGYFILRLFFRVYFVGFFGCVWGLVWLR